jgi:hypothetical protein
VLPTQSARTNGRSYDKLSERALSLQPRRLYTGSMTSAKGGSGPVVPEPEPLSYTIDQPADDEAAGVEVEVSDLGAPDRNASRVRAISSADARTRTPVAWYRQQVTVPRWLASACVLALLLLIVVDLVPNFGGQFLAMIAPTPTASPVVVAPAPRLTPTATPAPAATPVPTPTLVAPALGLAPADCPTSTGTLHVGGFPNELTYAVGGPDVWVDGFFSASAVTSITRDATGPYTQYGWPVAIALVLEDPFNAAVTLVAHDPRTNAPLWWSFANSDGYTVPAATFAIDPQQDQGLTWSTDGTSKWWEGALYLPGAGCYSLSASWRGGGWTATFAAGR